MGSECCSGCVDEGTIGVSERVSAEGGTGRTVQSERV